MQTFDQALFARVKAGRITFDGAMRVACSPGRITFDGAMRVACSPHDFKLFVQADGRRRTPMDDVAVAGARSSRAAQPEHGAPAQEPPGRPPLTVA